MAKEVRSVLANPERHSTTVVMFAEQLHQEYGLRAEAIRYLWKHREAHRAWCDIKRRVRDTIARRVEMVSRYDAATYLTVSNACHRLEKRPLFDERKLEVYLALEAAPRSTMALVHFLLTSKDKEAVAQAAKDYPGIFSYNPEQVSEILCWRLLAIMPAD